MKKGVSIFSLWLIVCSGSLVSCLPEAEEKAAQDIVKKIRTQEIVMESKKVSGCPSSIVEYQGDYYIANMGRDDYKVVDGDGFIMKTDAHFKNVDTQVFPQIKLNSPQGIGVWKDVLYVADIDTLVGIDLKTGQVKYKIDFSRDNMRFLKGMYITKKGVMYLCARDVNRLYKVDLNMFDLLTPEQMASGKNVIMSQVEPLVISSKDFVGPNALTMNPSEDKLYVACFAKDSNGDPTGKILEIDLKTNQAHVVYDQLGCYEGVAYLGESLIFSDWCCNQKEGAIKKYNLKTKELTIVSKIPLNGVGNFFIDRENSSIWIPLVLEGKILHATL